uniref:Predicted gene 128 n=1 Tax=Jaculus jaculus TaxID=51337 RepID=A0A8C5L3U6_JACJA
MVPAACVLLWALLVSAGPRAAGAQEQTSTPTPTPTPSPRASLRFGGPARSRGTGGPARPSVPQKTRMKVEEDENDALATADRLAGPAAAELLATVTGISRASDPALEQDEDGSLEEGVVIDTTSPTTTTTTSAMPPIHLRRRPLLPPPSPSPALAFWKKVRMGLEDIWNSLSSVFTEMQPVSVLFVDVSNLVPKTASAALPRIVPDLAVWFTES